MSDAGNHTTPVLRHALEQIRGRFSTEHERFVLFTTFNFSAPFFEANVLPLLVGDTTDDLQGAAEVRHAINDELGRAKCLVVCDHSTAPEPKGGMRYALLPVGLDRGRFHPKLMLMAGTLADTGEKGLWLFVASGNLTLSGWALNREIVGTTPVTPQHAGALLPLLDWLLERAQRQYEVEGADRIEEEGETRRILTELIAALGDPERLVPQTADLPTLHLALPFAGAPREGLLDRLKGPTPWQAATIVSPYWSHVDRLVARLGVGTCRFVPSINTDGRYRFPLATLNGAPAALRGFRRFRHDGERYTHAKAILLEAADQARVLCIGSANFTSAALLARDEARAAGALANVEAMLRYDLRGAADPWRNAFEALDEERLATPDTDQDEDGAPPLPPFLAEVLCKWDTHHFHTRLELLGDAAIRDVELRVDAEVVRYPALSAGRRETATLPFSGTQPVRAFFVAYTAPDGTRVTFPGLVTQANAMPDELGYQPRPRLGKVLDLLRGLGADEPEGRTRERVNLGLGGDGEEDTGEASFDFFGLFQGTWRLVQYYAKPNADGTMRDPYDPHAWHGITTLYRAVVEQPALSAEDRIGRYVQLREIEVVLGQLALLSDHGTFPFHTELGAQLATLRAEMRDLLGASAAFRKTFGAASAERVDRFLDWFRQEIAKSVATERESADAR